MGLTVQDKMTLINCSAPCLAHKKQSIPGTYYQLLAPLLFSIIGSLKLTHVSSSKQHWPRPTCPQVPFLFSLSHLWPERLIPESFGVSPSFLTVAPSALSIWWSVPTGFLKDLYTTRPRPLFHCHLTQVLAALDVVTKRQPPTLGF